MGRGVKDPRVTTAAGTALGNVKVAELTAASEAEAKRIVGAGGLPVAAIIVDVDKDGNHILREQHSLVEIYDYLMITLVAFKYQIVFHFGRESYFG